MARSFKGKAVVVMTLSEFFFLSSKDQVVREISQKLDVYLKTRFTVLDTEQSERQKAFQDKFMGWIEAQSKDLEESKTFRLREIKALETIAECLKSLSY